MHENNNFQVHSVEGRREGESMKVFKKRIREDTQQLVAQVHKDSSTTLKKKKEYVTWHFSIYLCVVSFFLRYLEQRKETKAAERKGSTFLKDQKEAQVTVPFYSNKSNFNNSLSSMWSLLF